MANIKKKFTYDLPDEYLAQTMELGLKGEWEYEGPEKVYVTVDKLTNIIRDCVGWIAHEDEATQEENDIRCDTYTGLDCYHAPIEFDKDPVLLSCVFPKLAGDLPQKEYKHPVTGEVFYSRPDPIMPDHTIEYGDIEYDLEKKEWKKPYPMRKPHITREHFETSYASILENIVQTSTEEYTSQQKKLWDTFIKDFKDVPVKFAEYLDSPWMVPFPNDPRMNANWTGENAGLVSDTSENLPPVQVVEPPQLPIRINEEVYDWVALAEAELTEEEKTAPEPPERFKIKVSKSSTPEPTAE